MQSRTPLSVAPVSRRTLLKGFAAGLGLAAAGPDWGRVPAAKAPTRPSGPGPGSDWAGAAPPGSRPYPHLRAGTDTLPKIDHIVVLMMENHSFDNYFGMLGRGDGFTLGHDGRPMHSNPDASGHPVRAYHSPSTCQAHYHVSQNWDVSHKSWDGGRNDGFVKAVDAPYPMAYFTGADLPFYYSLARTFPLCDRYFAS